MELVLVSACLLGQPVRYDGGHKRSGHRQLQQWLAEGRVVSLCPEIAGGLPVPRPPTEIVAGAGGRAVLAGQARIVDASAQDFSAAFVAGARHALALVKDKRIRVAVLKEGSPSCGSHVIHDGTFSATLVRGQGVTAALLADAGVRVFSEDQFDDACELLRHLEAAGAAPART